jgi:hypothetical protein
MFTYYIKESYKLNALDFCPKSYRLWDMGSVMGFESKSPETKLVLSQKYELLQVMSYDRYEL